MVAYVVGNMNLASFCIAKISHIISSFHYFEIRTVIWENHIRYARDTERQWLYFNSSIARFWEISEMVFVNSI